MLSQSCFFLDKHVLNLFSLFVFSLCHTSTLSYHTHTSNPPLSLSIFGPITSTHTSQILHLGQNWSKQPGTPKTHQNKLKFDPRWNRGDNCSSLYAGFEIFRPFQPEWNKINNNKLNYSSTSNCLQFNYWLRAELEEIKFQLLPQCYL